MRKSVTAVAITGLTLALAACGGPGQRPAPVPPEARTDPPTTTSQTIRESSSLPGNAPTVGTGTRQRGTTDDPTSATLAPNTLARIPGVPTAGSGARERGSTDAPTSATTLPNALSQMPGRPTAGTGPMQGR
ncbi:hypothetical protein [Pseudoroseomonas sp. WGS1072]|uniref:hypothetical protein n=1 Tax=Roseomonas sp. WGS1072 TaxID=3366816 RepID=UPI003BF013B4